MKLKDFFLGKSKGAKVIATLSAIITVVMFCFGWNSIKDMITTFTGWKVEPTTFPSGIVDPDSAIIDQISQYSTETQSMQKDLMEENNVFKGDNSYYTNYSGDELIANDNHHFDKGADFYVGDDGNCKSITFLLNREYSYISGYFYLPKEHKNLDYTQYFTIIGDGKKLYQSEGLTAGVAPIAFKVDVSNIETVEFEFSDEGAIYNTFLMSSNRCSHYLAEVYAYSE